MESVPIQITKQTAIKLNLWKQGLYHAPTADAPQDALTLLRRLGCIQLDTLNVVTRSHNLVFLARMKAYTEEWYWKLYEERAIVEEYVHALSILPVEDFPTCALTLQSFQDRLETVDPEKADFLQQIYEQIKRLAPKPVTSKDLNPEQEDVHFFESETANPKDWQTTPVRWSLDCLWRSGKLMQVRNRKFGKVYHLLEEWLPVEVREKQLSTKEIYERFVRKSLDAMGAATVADITDYFRLKRSFVEQALQDLTERGEVVPAELEGHPEPHFMLSTDLELIHFDALKAEPAHCAFLSPFDNLIWTRERLLRLFDVDYRLECYVPEAQRRFGYYALPILHHGRIVGTIDLKMERKAHRLVIQRFQLFETNVAETLVSDLVQPLHHLMQFLKAEQVTTEDNVHPEANALATLVNKVNVN